MDEENVVFEEWEISFTYLEEIVPLGIGFGCGQGCVGIDCLG